MRVQKLKNYYSNKSAPGKDVALKVLNNIAVHSSY